MIRASAILALWWEQWRLTRFKLLLRLVLILPLAASANSLPHILSSFFHLPPNAPHLTWVFSHVFTPTVALFVLLNVDATLPLSVARVNGGKILDGYRPGYTFPHLFFRPMSTPVIVGAQMACYMVSHTALYAVSAFILQVGWGYSFLCLPAAAWVATAILVQWPAQWGTTHKLLQWLGAVIPYSGLCLMFWVSQQEPLMFSPLEYALLALTAVASFGLTVVGVAQQRRGDVPAARPRAAGGGGADWFSSLLRIPCPTTSPIQAQIWFNLKAGGLLVLAIGAGLALLIPFLTLVPTRLDVALAGFFPQPATRAVPVLVGMAAVPLTLLLSGNAFGIRARQGRKYASPFEATQACTTAQMAGIKVLVRTVCVLIAFAMVTTSAWVCAHLFPFDVLGDQDTFFHKSQSPLSSWMRATEATVVGMGLTRQLALLFVACTGVAAFVAWRASLSALEVRHPRGVGFTTLALLIGAYLLFLYVKGLQIRMGLPAWHQGLLALLIRPALETPGWMAFVTLFLATGCLLWRGFVERLLTLRSASLGALLSVAFALAWLTVLQAGGVSLSALPTGSALWLLLPTLLLPLTSLLGAWSLSHVRHL